MGGALCRKIGAAMSKHKMADLSGLHFGFRRGRLFFHVECYLFLFATGHRWGNGTFAYCGAGRGCVEFPLSDDVNVENDRLPLSDVLCSSFNEDMFS